MEAPRRAAIEPEDDGFVPASHAAAPSPSPAGSRRLVEPGEAAPPVWLPPAAAPPPVPQAPPLSTPPAVVPPPVIPAPPSAPPPTYPVVQPGPVGLASEPAPVPEPVDDGDDYDDVYGDDYDDGHRGHPIRTLLVWLIVLAVVGTGGYFGVTKGIEWLRSQTPVGSVADYPGPGEGDVVVTIRLGASASEMATVLLGADVVASEKAFTNAVDADPITFSRVQAGDHELRLKMSGEQALVALADPRLVVVNQFTVPPGLTLPVILDRISQQTGVPLADLERVAADPSALGLPDWAVLSGPDIDGNALQGYLFPETYAYDATPTAEEVLGTMVSQFVKVTNDIGFAAKAQAQGMTPAEAVVLASLIERESADPVYAPDISQVFHNRLAIDMRLQSDATLNYAMGRIGSSRPMNAETLFDSPYNTYRYPGLMPGPIASPGKTALAAAVNPTEGSYLFFVTVNLKDGVTKFASNDAEFEVLVGELDAWCAANTEWKANNPGHCGVES